MKKVKSMKRNIGKNKVSFLQKIIITIIILAGLVALVCIPPSIIGYPSVTGFYQDLIGKMTSEPLSGIVYLKNVPIHLEGDTGFTQYDLDKLTEEVPDVLLENCSDIYICDFKNPNAVFYQFSDENHMDAHGLTIWDGSGRIYIDNNADKLSVLIHEAMHRYDEIYGLSNTPQIQNLFNTYKVALSEETKDNAQKDESEFLSEASVLYFTNPKTLQTTELHPVYDYFQNLFHYYA